MPVWFSSCPILALRRVLVHASPVALLRTALTMAWMGALCVAANAQVLGLPPGAGPTGNPMCGRLEAQLAALDRGGGDGRADQLRRLEDTAARQQSEIDRASLNARRMGCESSGLLSIFGRQPEQCGPLNTQIQQLRAALDQTLTSLERMRSGGASDRDGQRRSILLALAQNNCGPQYAGAARATPGSILGNIFGGAAVDEIPPGPVGSGYRTVCVRSCDGYFFPISFSTSPSRFSEDERLCKRQCPATEVALYAYRNPGEDMNHAMSISGQPYTRHPNAFRYRQQFDAACSCRLPGQSWADALKGADDRSTLERGDTIVTEERARQLSMPRDAQGRPVRGTPVPVYEPADQGGRPR